MKKGTANPPPAPFTKSQVFILESLRVEDEIEQRYEGKILADMLRLCGKQPAYYYFRTEAELVQLAQLYRMSGYRFLHISSHGSNSAIHTTLEDIPFNRFAEIFKGLLKNRRLFVSACDIGSGMFSELVRGQNKGMHSIASPMDTIRFDRAAAMWGAFYVRMFDGNPDKMKSADIQSIISNLCRFFGVRFNWSWYDASNDRWHSRLIQ